LTSARLRIAVKPGSEQAGIALCDGEFTLRVRERAIDGAANAACVRALAQHLGVAASRVELLRGARGRVKWFGIAGMTAREALDRLERAALRNPNAPGAMRAPR
jgi:uncharacterized protein YggU (UPF0235/DUF167 family)